MVVLTIVTQNNGETVYFDQPIPKVHFMKLLSCSLYNSWDTLKNEGSTGLVDGNNNPSGSISKLAAGHYDLDSLAKKITDMFSQFNYRGLETETNTPLGQLVINNFGAKSHYIVLNVHSWKPGLLVKCNPIVTVNGKYTFLYRINILWHQ